MTLQNIFMVVGGTFVVKLFSVLKNWQRNHMYFFLGKMETFYNLLEKVVNKALFVDLHNRIESEAFFFFLLFLS